MTIRRKLVIFFLCAILAVTAKPIFNELPRAEANVSETMIRVGLNRNLASGTIRIDGGTYSLRDESLGLPIGTLSQGDTIQFNRIGSSIQVVINGAVREVTFRGPIYMEVIDATQLNIFSYNNIRYRDNLRVLNDDNNMAFVNVLDIERYLYGVVGPEMGTSAPLEALKAQAVVSRSYALNLFRPNNRWDVGIDTATQVYRGYSAETAIGGINAVQAVDATRGEVIYYQFNRNGTNRPIAAFFHANSGGHTEDSQNVWLNPLPYIRAVPSPFDSFALEHPQDQNGWPANSYQWNVNMTRGQLLDRINMWNANNANNPDSLILIGHLEDIRICRLQRDSQVNTLSGRVTELELRGSNGSASVYRDRIRTLLGLRSTLFNLRTDAQLTIINGNGVTTTVNQVQRTFAVARGNISDFVNSQQNEYFVVGAGNNIVVKPKIFENIIIEGYGHGHGLGMSQWGAMGMARAGYSYTEIIEHYYNRGLNCGALVITQYQ